MSVSLLFRLSNKNHSEEMVLVGSKAAYAVARTLGKKSGTSVRVEGPFPFSPWSVATATMENRVQDAILAEQFSCSNHHKCGPEVRNCEQFEDGLF